MVWREMVPEFVGPRVSADAFPAIKKKIIEGRS